MDDTTGPLPRFGEVIRDAERLGAQMLAVLSRAVDPASEPTELAWPQVSDRIGVHDVLLATARRNVADALNTLASAAALPVPPVGSAIKIPARQDPEASGPASPVATPDGPVSHPDLDPGEEPTPGSAAVAATAARESAGSSVGPRAGASSGPSPRHTALDRAGGRRGAGPGYLGATP